MDKYCVYRHRRHDTNKIFYIGIGTIERAYKKSKYQRNFFWVNITNKTTYSVEILKENLTWDDAVELEILLIKEYGRKDLGLGTLCNLTDGGEGTTGRILSENHIKRLRESSTGKIPSKESEIKMSKAKKGMYFLDENPNSKSIINIETGEVFKSLKEVSILENINYSTFKWSMKHKLNFKYKYI